MGCTFAQNVVHIKEYSPASSSTMGSIFTQNADHHQKRRDSSTSPGMAGLISTQSVVHHQKGFINGFRYDGLYIHPECHPSTRDACYRPGNNHPMIPSLYSPNLPRTLDLSAQRILLLITSLQDIINLQEVILLLSNSLPKKTFQDEGSFYRKWLQNESAFYI